jgi:hypothetical protein
MSAMPAERVPRPPEKHVQLLIPSVPISLRTRIKIIAAKRHTNMSKLELEALQIGLDILDPDTNSGVNDTPKVSPKNYGGRA